MSNPNPAKKTPPGNPTRLERDCYSDIDSGANSGSAQAESIELFSELIRQTLDRSSLDGYKLFAWATHLIRQFGLEQSEISSESLILEIFLRGIAHLKAGKPMPVPAGWINKALYRVVREEARREKRQTDLKRLIFHKERSASYDEETLIAGRSIHELKGALKQALRALEPRQRRILYYYHCYGWDWQRIAAYLEERGEESPNLEALRQQASRARKRLRKIILNQLSVNCPVEPKK